MAKQSEIESRSQQTISSTKPFFVPSLVGSMLVLLIGTVLLALYNWSQIINWLGNDYLGSADKLNLNLGTLNNGFSSSFTSALGGRLGQIIVWSVVGALAYILIWFLRNIFNSFENDVIVDHYLHPSNFNRAGYWGSSVAGKIFFADTFLLWVIYSFLALKIVLPAAASLTSSAICNFRLANSLIYLLLCILIAGVTVYLWVLIARIVSHLWKLL